MKKFVSWFCIILGLAILVTGTSARLTILLHERKNPSYNKSWWGEHGSPNGDLVTMAYLDDVDQFKSPKDYFFHKAGDTGQKNIDLYIWGDSYLEDVPGNVFAGVRNYHYGRNFFGQLVYHLDKSQRNILVIETAERFFRPYFIGKSIYSSVKHDSSAAQSAGKGAFTDNFFDAHINQNIESLLFNYNFLNAPRCWKSDINYYAFGRASGNVAVSDDKRNLFLKETLLPRHGYSCYEVLPDKDIRWYVAELNNIYNHYREEGFDEVYLAIIPNPASILQPRFYNNLIPRVAADTTLKMHMLNIYPAFKDDKDPHRLYRAGDTHWNNAGFQLWLAMTNDTLAAQNDFRH